MYGLKIKREYIIDIINKKKTNMSYMLDTSIRGKIGLIDLDTYELIAYANLYDTTKTTYEEHLLLSARDSYTKAEAINLINKLDFTKLKSNAYLYEFKDIETLPIPYQINVIDENQIWIKFDENELQKGYEQISLF